MKFSRRSILACIAAAPMIVRAGSLMPVRTILSASTGQIVALTTWAPGDLDILCNLAQTNHYEFIQFYEVASRRTIPTEYGLHHPELMIKANRLLA